MPRKSASLQKTLARYRLKQLEEQGGVASPVPENLGDLGAWDSTNYELWFAHHEPDEGLPTYEKFKSAGEAKDFAARKCIMYELAYEQKRLLTVAVTKKRKTGAQPYAGLGVDALWTGSGDLTMSQQDWRDGLGSQSVWRAATNARSAAIVQAAQANGQLRRSAREVDFADGNDLVEARGEAPWGYPQTSYWRSNYDNDSFAVSLVTGVVGDEAMVRLGVSSMYVIWTPEMCEYLMATGIMLNLSRCLTVAAVTTFLCLDDMRKQDAAHRGKAHTAELLAKVPTLALVEPMITAGLLTRDTDFNLVPGPAYDKMVTRFAAMRRSGSVKFYFNKIIMLAVQMALVSGLVRFDQERLSAFACVQGKLFVAATLWRADKGITYASSIGLDCDARIPLEGTNEEFLRAGYNCYPLGVKFTGPKQIYELVKQANHGFMLGRIEAMELATEAYAASRRFSLGACFESPLGHEISQIYDISDACETTKLLYKNSQAWPPQIVNSGFYLWAEAAAAQLFRNIPFQDLTGPTSLRLLFDTRLFGEWYDEPNDDPSDWTIWCGCDYVLIYYRRNGDRIVLDKRTILRLRIVAMMEARQAEQG